jgi:hypothetical protein
MYSECFGQSTSIYKADERSALRQQMEIQLSELHPLHGRTLYMSLRCNVAILSSLTDLSCISGTGQELSELLIPLNRDHLCQAYDPDYSFH